MLQRWEGQRRRDDNDRAQCSSTPARHPAGRDGLARLHRRQHTLDEQAATWSAVLAGRTDADRVLAGPVTRRRVCYQHPVAVQGGASSVPFAIYIYIYILDIFISDYELQYFGGGYVLESNDNNQHISTLPASDREDSVLKQSSYGASRPRSSDALSVFLALGGLLSLAFRDKPHREEWGKSKGGGCLPHSCHPR